MRILNAFALRAAWLLALSMPAVVLAQEPASSFSYSRTSSFTYWPNGQIQTETIEPSNAASCVQTTHSYDAYGNKSGSTTSNCSGASGRAVFTQRTATTTFSSQSVVVAGVSVSTGAGVFPTSASNGLGHTESRLFDPRFGALVSVTSPNGSTVTRQLDEFGRITLEIQPDNTRTSILRCILSGRGVDTTSNVSGCLSAGYLSGDATEVPAEALSFTQTRTQKADGTQLAAAVRTYSDRAGRTLRVLTEGFDGTSQPADRRYIATDTSYDPQGNANYASAPYFWGKGSTTLQGLNDAGAVLTARDDLGRVTRTDVLDPAGSVSVTVNGQSVKAARTTIAYSGRSTTTTNDLGKTRTEVRYVNGKLAQVTDALGAQIAYEYDAFDNLIKTQDALQNLVTVAYDIRGRRIRVADPDSGTTEFDYNAMGELVWQRNSTQRAAGTATTFVYDGLGRMVQRLEPEYTTTWYYDLRADGTTCMDAVAGVTSPGKGKLCETNTSHGINKKLRYDALGRPLQARTSTSDGPSFGSETSYEAGSSRVVGLTYPTGFKVDYVYTARGFLSQVRNTTALTGVAIPAGTALWAAGQADAAGRFGTQSVANGVVTRATFEPRAGRVTALTAGTGVATNVLNHAYTWDSLGNLKTRADNNGDGATGAVTETFVYDAVNRLEQYQVASSQIPNLARTVNLSYNAIGNLIYKSDVGNYDYPDFGNVSGSTRPRPHAVSRIVGGPSFGTVNYLYDANGNVTSSDNGKWRTVSYTSFNLPDSNLGLAGPNAALRYTWQYDDQHQRIKEVRVNLSGTRTTWFVHPDNAGGLAFEHEVAPNGGISNRHYVTAAGQTLVIVNGSALPSLGTGLAPAALSSLAVSKTEYWHKDHLGSIASTTNQSAVVTARYSYDPFGKRRTASGQYDAFGNVVVDWSTSAAGTDRGFTGHEHLDDVGVVHMNGRLFEPTVARFMQADPIVEAPGNLQSYNRYSYLQNNPLNGTDPSGYCGFCRTVRNHLDDSAAWLMNFHGDNFPGQRAVDRYISRHQWAYQVGQIVVTAVATYYGGMWAGAAAGAQWTAYYGYQQTGDIRSAMKAGAVSFATAVAFYYVGEWTTSSGTYLDPDGYMGTYTQVDAVPNIVGHAAVGCASAERSGGSCRNGAMSGAAGSAWSNFGYRPQGSGAFAANLLINSVVGGTASVLGGGKFWNGAKTAAFGYLFNECLHTRACGMGQAGYSSRDSFESPLGLDLAKNEEYALAIHDLGPLGKFVAFRAMVDYGAPWDYKRLGDGEQYENFGNWHYGYMGAAAGFSDEVLFRAAGYVQRATSAWFGEKTTLQGVVFGVGGTRYFGDDPKDAYWIRRGIDDYRAKQRR